MWESVGSLEDRGSTTLKSLEGTGREAGTDAGGAREMTGWDHVWHRGSKGRSTFSKPFAARLQKRAGAACISRPSRCSSTIRMRTVMDG